MRLVLTTEWTSEEMEPYAAEVDTALRHLVAWMPMDETLDSLYGQLLRGEKQLWLALEDDGEFVLAIMTRDSFTVAGKHQIEVTGVGGKDAARVIDHFHVIEDWGRARGAVELEAIGRRGWEPLVRRHGWKPVATVFRKRLD